jgi:hypothetical protein
MSDDRDLFSDLLLAGQMLSNCAYNLKQSRALDERTRTSLGEAQERWDAVVKEAYRRGVNAVARERDASRPDTRSVTAAGRGIGERDR